MWSRDQRERARRKRLARQNAHDQECAAIVLNPPVAGWTAAALADALEAAGIRAPGGGERWSPTAAWRVQQRLLPRCAHTDDLFGEPGPAAP
ncbi:MAG: hypothetical protein OXI07_09040 [Gammaproteobacteria bacterium]|nr:hypothetical protein [Gammaproteobacteria bacterium]